MDGRRRLMGNSVEMATMYIGITADKNPPSSTTIDVNGVTYNIDFGWTNGILVQVPAGQPCTITPSAVPNYITPDPQIVTPNAGNNHTLVKIDYKIDLVWVPIYFVSSGTPSSSTRPCFGYRASSSSGNYGEMTTLKNLGSVIYGIRGTSKLSGSGTLSLKPSVILNNNASIQYYMTIRSGYCFQYAYIYDLSNNKITSETDGYWTLTFYNPTSITLLMGGSTLISKDLSWIQVTRSTYAAVTGLDYPTT